jgi:hypothetical membrane protein
LSCFGCFDEDWRVALLVECWDFVIFAAAALINSLCCFKEVDVEFDCFELCITITSWLLLSKSRGSDPMVFYRVQVGITETPFVS